MVDTSWVLQTPFAHRGLHSGEAVPENSLAAFQAAADAGYGIELDVHLGADGAVVVFHDDDLRRMVGDERRTRELTRETARAVRLYGGDQHIPALDDVIALTAGRVPLLIELKGEDTSGALEQAVTAQLRAYSGRAAVQSFHPWTVSWFRKHAPEIPRGQLSYDYADEPGIAATKRFLYRNLLYSPLNRPHFVGYDILSIDTLRAALATKVFGARLLFWTVRSAEQEQRARSFGGNIIFENFTPHGAR